MERLAREMALRLPQLRPERYRVFTPPAGLAHRAGHLWEQAVLPVRAARCTLIYSPANLAPLAGCNVVVIHDLAALRFPEAYSRSYVTYQRLMLPSIARRALLLITVSEFSKQELVELLGVAPERIAVIAEGVDERFLAAGEGGARDSRVPGSGLPDAAAPGSAAPDARADDAAAVPARYRLERPYVLAVGTISARKNLALLEPAARALAERGIELVLAGSDRGYLRAPPVTVRRLGYVADEDLPGLYKGALALAMPSLYEGFGLPCLEAMACGTPVVAVRGGALPETIGDAGILLDAGDRDGFASALLEVARDERLRSRLRDAGRARAAAFPWSRTAALTDAALEPLLAQR